MQASDLVQLLSQALYVIVFVLALGRAIRSPRPATIEMALLFGVAAVSVAFTWIVLGLHLTPPRIAGDIDAALLMFLPYLLLRLVDEFAGVPVIVQRLSELALVVVVAARLLAPSPAPLWSTELLVAYFAASMLYVTVAFGRAAKEAVGLTARRLAAVAIGCGCLETAIVLAGLRAAFPVFDVPFGVLGGPFGLASGVAFYLGFTPPGWLRAAWREPELVAFWAQSDVVANEPDLSGVISGLQQAVSGALGLPGAFVGVWNEAEGVLEYAPAVDSSEHLAALVEGASLHEGLLSVPADKLVGGACFSRQQPLYSENVAEVDPDHSALYLASGVRSVLAAPVTVDGDRYGVLGVYTSQPRLFAEDSLALIQLLARRAANMLRTRDLLHRAASVRAQEELGRLKEEFLSAATHDLKTPLTSIKGMAQLMRRHLQPGVVVGESVSQELLRIEDATNRMTGLVDELLDVSRLQMARPLEMSATAVDLAAMARRVAERHQSMTSTHRIRVEAPSELVGWYDGQRLERVVENLLGNALKFSPSGGEVLLVVRIQDDRPEGPQLALSVRDEGIGIEPQDLERIFERFERGVNATSLGITGTGIGLAYVSEIVRANGGSVGVDSTPGAGSTFTVRLPLRVPATDQPVGAKVHV